MATPNPALRAAIDRAAELAAEHHTAARTLSRATEHLRASRAAFDRALALCPIWTDPEARPKAWTNATKAARHSLTASLLCAILGAIRHRIAAARIVQEETARWANDAYRAASCGGWEMQSAARRSRGWGAREFDPPRPDGNEGPDNWTLRADLAARQRAIRSVVQMAHALPFGDLQGLADRIGSAKPATYRIGGRAPVGTERALAFLRAVYWLADARRRDGALPESAKILGVVDPDDWGRVASFRIDPRNLERARRVSRSSALRSAPPADSPLIAAPYWGEISRTSRIERAVRAAIARRRPPIEPWAIFGEPLQVLAQMRMLGFRRRVHLAAARWLRRFFGERFRVQEVSGPAFVPVGRPERVADPRPGLTVVKVPALWRNPAYGSDGEVRGDVYCWRSCTVSRDANATDGAAQWDVVGDVYHATPNQTAEEVEQAIRARTAWNDPVRYYGSPSYSRETPAEARARRRANRAATLRRLRRLAEISTADSYDAGNCIPGTAQFLRSVGVQCADTHRDQVSLSGRALAVRWRRSGYSETGGWHLFRAAIDRAEKRALASV